MAESIKVTYRSLEGALDLLRGKWDDSRHVEHFILSQLIMSHFMALPGITANKYMGVVNEFIDRNGPYGVDGIFLSAISSCINFDKNLKCIRESNSIGKSLNRRFKYSFKEKFFIHFADFLGFTNTGFSYQLPDRIIGMDKSNQPLNYNYGYSPSINENYDPLKFEPIEYNSKKDLFLTKEKSHSAIYSYIPDFNRNRIFEEFGITDDDSRNGISSFGKRMRAAGENRNIDDQLRDGKNPWLMHPGDYKDPQKNDAFFKTAAVLAGAAYSLALIKGDNTNRAKVIGGGTLSTIAGIWIVDANEILKSKDSEEIARGYFDEVVDQVEDIPTSIRITIQGDTEERIRFMPLDDILPNDSDSTSTPVDSTDDDSEYDMVFTREELGLDKDGNKIEYPLPDAIGKPRISEEKYGYYLQKILNGNPDENIIYPNPEKYNHSGFLLTNIRINPLDLYIYPKPDGNSKKSFDEEDLAKLIKQKLHEIIYPKPDDIK